MKLNITAAENLLNDRRDICEMAQSGPADRAYLNGIIAGLRAIGLEPEIKNDKYVIYGVDKLNDDEDDDWTCNLVNC